VVLVAVAAAAAATVSVGVAALQSRGETTAAAGETGTPRRGMPPLALDLGFRTDAEARRLRRASSLLAAGRRAEAAQLFARSRSLDGRVGAAVAAWPRGTIPALRRLAVAHPHRGFVRLDLGLALLWAGQEPAAEAAWRQAVRSEPDSPAAIQADDLLNPHTPRGLPQFVPSFGPPRSIAALPPARQLTVLRRAAINGGMRERLLLGVAFQRIGRPVSAQRAFAAAARAAPRNVEALVADAVGRFRKSRPAPAFARLGPLTARYGGQPTVRFHLGLLLLWLGQVDDARRQLTLARSAGPQSPLGREAARFLRALDRDR
jgi:tetratricopeptide (TPR) repeat protein